MMGWDRARGEVCNSQAGAWVGDPSRDLTPGSSGGCASLSSSVN